MGFNVGMYSSNEDSKAMQLADYKYIGPIDDKQTLKMFAERCDVVMYDNDFIDSDIIRYISEFTSVPQSDGLLDIIQDRLIERSFFWNVKYQHGALFNDRYFRGYLPSD